jgi:hypothetical protein
MRNGSSLQRRAREREDAYNACDGKSRKNFFGSLGKFEASEPIYKSSAGMKYARLKRDSIYNASPFPFILPSFLFTKVWLKEACKSDIRR